LSGIDPVSIPDFMSREGMRALQLTKSKKLVKTCYERVPLTRRRMDEKGVKPEDIKSLEDIKLLPFMMKTVKICPGCMKMKTVWFTLRPTIPTAPIPG
jgi:phenylacetate-coenzyme A ligase PaaK-like adenylate-forming protein